MGEPQQKDSRHMTKGSKAPSIFQLANQEFESNEWESESPSGETLLKSPATSEETFPSSRTQGAKLMSPEGPAALQNEPLGGDPPAAPSSEQAALEDMKRFMEECGVDLETVAQAFLKTSGEVAAVARCLRSGPHSKDRPPLWTRQDDLDLLTGDNQLRSQLIAKYGKENVNRRVAFRKN
ncbi:telomeric repeat-binding factor 2-interacting protein 1 isoform X2 [Sphaerodactylus townsendi]|nr:telomeric repeat-binding factor 2-interacting protein 1 isoform X2 [Sphaerodactylus townsendi]